MMVPARRKRHFGEKEGRAESCAWDRSDPGAEHFEELPISANVSKRGIYFHTHLPYYRRGMRLFVTYPFTFTADPIKSEYLAEVVRVEHLADSRFGIAVSLIMTV
jgi:hypothetical protein